MRRRATNRIKLPIFADEDKVERIKLSYHLHGIVRLKRKNANAYYYCDKPSRQEDAFYKVANKLDALGIDDIEGYIGSAYRLFDPIYPNMLLSAAVEKHFEKTIPARLALLTQSFYSAYQASRVRIYQLGLLGEQDRETLHRDLADIHPIFLSWYYYNQQSLSVPDALATRARLAYLLWPLGYHRAPPWQGVIKDLGFCD